MSDNGFPSMTALLGLLAIAGYQNRDKLSEWFGGSGQGRPQPQDAPAGFDRVIEGAPQGGLGSILGGGLQEMIDRFRQGGRGEEADSWVGTGANRPITADQLEQTLGADTIADLSRRTGLSREELLGRLSQRLPDAVDRYTPDGRIAG